MIATPPPPASGNRIDTTPRELLVKLRSLPPFNSVAVKLLGLTADAEVNLRRIEESVNADPSLAGQLLVVANSPFFGLSSQIATVKHALAIVGLELFRQMVATAATSSYMRTLPADWVKPIWAHAVATAVIAEQLAQRSKNASGGLLYTAGLMHDLGRLGMLASEREAYHQFLCGEYPDMQESERLEREQFGMTHTGAGSFLMRTWGFPELLCSHAKSHHEHSEQGDRIIGNACLLADCMGYPELTLQTGSQPENEGRQNECLKGVCRELVEKKIQEALQ